MKPFRQYISEASSEDAVLPAVERFQQKMPVSGVVVWTKPVKEQVRYSYKKGLWRSTGPWVHRLSVLIRTVEGWMLSGKIGKALDRAGVPDVRVGDRILVDPIQLDRSYHTNAQRKKGIFTPNTLQRTLTGKVVGRGR